MKAAELWQKSPSVPVRYRCGDSVRVRMADPPGHIRTPLYIQGQVGAIERFCGTFPNPEEIAYKRPGMPAQPLYRVRFRQTDIWPDYQGESHDVLDVDIYQHWLEPA